MTVNDLYVVRLSIPGGLPLDELDSDRGEQDDEDLEPDVKTTEIVDAWYHDMLRRVERGQSNVPLSTIQSTRQAMLSRLAQSGS